MNRSELLIRDLRMSLAAGETVMTIHYACESWYTVTDRPVGISCIAIVDLCTGGETAFSVIDRREDGEVSVLERYYEFLRAHSDARIVHWNMNSSEFGFLAIDNRYTFLTQKVAPYKPSADSLFDLDELLIRVFGSNYADHPKLLTLASMNGFHKRYFLSGKEEADRYANQQHVDIRRSTAEKARLISFLLDRLLNNTLVTTGSGPHLDFADSTIDSVRVLTTLAERFRDVARQLERRHASRETLKIQDEYDAQDLFHALLRIFFADIRKEEWTPSDAGGPNRIDFLLPTHKVAVELKWARPTSPAPDVGDQLIVDAAHYRVHPDVRHLVCLVFDDSKYIENPRGLEKDLTGTKDDLLITLRIID